MTALAPIPLAGENLPGLIDRAATMLASAKTAAEVLEAREAAGLAYDVAKRAARLKNAKAAHDDLVAAAHLAQADALEIEAAAKRRLADEYDAAQERGDVAGHGGGRNFKVGDPHVETQSDGPNRVDGHNAIVTMADLGLRRDQIHDARLIRDAETADPGLVRRTLDERHKRGEEPTRSAVRRAAEDKLQRSLDRLQRIQESVRRLEQDRPPPLTPEMRARQIAVFGTQEDRAICGRIEEIIFGLGYYNSGPSDGFGGGLALWRISATAPTTHQISKIYEDERKLFMLGAQCTLYGTNDAVTALAHDPKTNLLHVGTSAGRSTFGGLVRVANTTTPIATAISAVNGLIAEQ